MLEVKTDEKIKTHRGFKISLIGRNSEVIYNERVHALIGISPFNSYFDYMIRLPDDNSENINQSSL